MKLRVYAELNSELEVEVDGGNLEDIKAQTFSLTGIEPGAQMLYFGPAAAHVEDDTDLQTLLDGELQPGTRFLSVVNKQTLYVQSEGSCTRVFLGSKPAIQPMYCLPESERLICKACASLCFPPDLAMSQPGPLRVSKHAFGQLKRLKEKHFVIFGDPQSFCCAAVDLCDEGLGLYIFRERWGEAGALEINHESDHQKDDFSSAMPSLLIFVSSLQAAAVTQQAHGFSNNSPEVHRLRARLQGALATVTRYDSLDLQNRALTTIPLANLHERAVLGGGDPVRAVPEFRDLLLRELTAWFKQRFFKWINEPPCDVCGEGTTMVGGAAPTLDEQLGEAARVEVYKCNATCTQQTRFPRFNDSGRLLHTRRGRCGEWANCFTLCCRALGFEARYILDWTDHVWTEVYSPSQRRWLHVDPCENRIDHPLMYEAGWGKKLTYVVAFAKDGVCDVTRRYTRRYTEVLERRTDLPEAIFQAQIAAFDKQARARYLNNDATTAMAREQELRTRACREEYELTCGTRLNQSPTKRGELQGRISGSGAWKRVRGEDGRNAPADTKLHPPPMPLEDRPAQIHVVEREDVCGVPTHPDLGPGRASQQMLVSIYSVGSSDMDLYLFGGPLLGPEAITINGIPLAVGLRGLNVCTVDLKEMAVRRSVVIGTAGPAQPGEGISPKVYSTVEEVLRTLPDGSLVAATVLGHGPAEAYDANLWGPGFIKHTAPTGGQSWLLLGQKGTSHPPSWALAECREPSQGPIDVRVTVPIPKTSEAVSKAMSWEEGIPCLPLWHATPREEHASAWDAQDIYRREQAAPRAQLLTSGYTYRPERGMAIVGPFRGIRSAPGWVTKCSFSTTAVFDQLVQPSTPDIQARVKAVFAELTASGISPTAAAAQAFVKVKESLQEVPKGCTLRTLPRHGTPRPSEGESWAFNDTDVACPESVVQAWNYERDIALPCAVLSKIRVWASPDRILGLQAVYTAGKECICGPMHYSTATVAPKEDSASLVELLDDESLKHVKICASPQGILGLAFESYGRHLGSWGQHEVGLEGSQIHTDVIDIEGGWEACAFYGSVAKKGLQTLGVAVRRSSRHTFLGFPPRYLWGLYSACPIDHACRQLLLWSGRARALLALQTATRYLANCIREPANSKFRHVRCGTAFFHKNVGSTPGSGLLMAAMGFQLEMGEAEDDLCYNLPLQRAGPDRLQTVLQSIRINVARLQAISPEA